MSAVSGTSSGLYAMLQAIQGQSSTTASTSATSARSQRPEPPGMDAFWNSELESQGITGSALTDLRQKMDAAAESAKESSTDPEAVKTAVQQVLKDAGVDVDQVEADMKAQGGPGGPGGPRGSQGSDETSAQLTAQLQALGITDTSSFLSALQDYLSANSKTTSVSDLFATIPTGSQVNVLA